MSVFEMVRDVFDESMEVPPLASIFRAALGGRMGPVLAGLWG